MRSTMMAMMLAMGLAIAPTYLPAQTKTDGASQDKMSGDKGDNHMAGQDKMGQDKMGSDKSDDHMSGSDNNMSKSKKHKKNKDSGAMSGASH